MLRAAGHTHDSGLSDSAVLGAGRTPNAAQAARMQVRLDTGHVLPVRDSPLRPMCIQLSQSAT